MLFSKLKRRMRDRGDSTLVSTIIVIPLIVAILITIVDTSIFFMNRNVILSSTRDAVRTVSIFGGNGTNTQETKLEKAYGSAVNPCSGLVNNPNVQISGNPMTKNTAIECQLMANLSTSAGLTNVTITKVTCGPSKSNFIGQQAFCDVQWKYAGVPGSGLTLLRAAGNANVKAGGGLDGVMTTRVTTTTEVNLNDSALVNRN